MTTRSGLRLLWMLATEKTRTGKRWPRAFDARLTERIVEEFVPAIEHEAKLTERARIRAGVEDMPWRNHTDDADALAKLVRAAVLDIIDERKP